MFKSSSPAPLSAARRWWIGPVVGLLVVFMGLRIHALLNFPAFLDEIVHIDWADDLYDGHPFTGASNGKLFGLWWMTLFGLEGDGALFLVRYATVLFGALGAALVFSLARQLANPVAGLVALTLYCLAPYSIFYDRLGLVDPYLTVWAAFVVWLALRYVRQGRWLDAVAAGLAVTGCILAKANGLTQLAVPVVVIGLLPANMSWLARLKGLALSYGAFAVSWLSVFFFLRWRGYDYFSTATSVVGTDETGGVVARTLDNIQAMWKINVAYFSLPFLLVGIALVVYLVGRKPRVGLLLLGGTLVPLGGTLVFATKLSPRYFYFHVPLLLVTLAVAWSQLDTDLQRLTGVLRRGGRLIGPTLAVLWSLLVALPFYVQYLRDPVALALPDIDRLEYITSDAAGFAIPELAAYLRDHAESGPDGSPVVVIGLFANCGALEYYLADSEPLQLECPRLEFDMKHQAAVIARVDELADAPAAFWLVLEEGPYISLDGITVPLVTQATFTRPDQLTRLELLYAAAGSQTEKTAHD